MIRYVDDNGRLKVKLRGLSKPSEIWKRKNRPVITLKKIEEEVKEMLEEKRSKAFFCLDVKAVLTVITAWEIISTWYYLGIVALRWASECEDIFYFLFNSSQIPGFFSSIILHPMGWVLLFYLPDKNVCVVCCSLAIHILVTIIFVAGCLCAYFSSSYMSLYAYAFLSFTYAYIDVLYNSLMNDISDGKYDIFQDIARCIERILDYINSKL